MNSIWFLVRRIFEQKIVPHGLTKPQGELEVFVRSALILLALAVSAPPASPQSGVEGHLAGLVYEDRNQDGSRDPGEPGIPGVVVCTRSDCALADAEGLYEVAVQPGYQVVWVSQPDGYRAKRGFFRRIPEDPFEWLVNFPLERGETVSSFSFLHASDTHVDAESLPRMQRLREIATARGVDFVLITGDLIRDALRVPEATATSRGSPKTTPFTGRRCTSATSVRRITRSTTGVFTSPGSTPRTWTTAGTTATSTRPSSPGSRRTSPPFPRKRPSSL